MSNAIDRQSGRTLTFSAVFVAFLLIAGVVVAQVGGPPIPVPSAAPAAQGTVRDVLIQGNRGIPSQRIVGYISTKPGMAYSQERINDDVRKLYETKQFGNVIVRVEEPQTGLLDVIYYVVEYPNRIEAIVYQGAGHVKEDDLNKETGLHKGMTMNPILNRTAVSRLLDYYRDKGRPFAHVELLEGLQPTDKRVVFQITEGPKVRVRSLQFEGNTFVSGAVLSTHLNTSRAFLGLLGGTYNANVTENDANKLIEYYRSHGFRDVRVSCEKQFSPSQEYLTLVFHIYEGPRYRVVDTQVEVSGVNPERALQRRQELKPFASWETGKYYNELESKKNLARMQDWLGYQGHDCKVIEQVVHKENSDEIIVKYQVYEPPAVRVGSIKIVGNDTTKENVIRRQLRIFPNQILSYPDLRRSEQNLARLGIFEVNPESGVKPTVEVLPTEDELNPYRDVLVSIQETRTGSLTFSVGVNSDNGLNGSVVLNERNFDIWRAPTSIDDLLSGQAFRGAGQEFRLELSPGTQAQRYAVSWREPFLFDTPNSLKLDGYFFARGYDEYLENRTGGRVTVGRRIGDFWSVSLGSRLENVAIHDVPSFAPKDIQDARGSNFIYGLRTGLGYDDRDSILRATEGQQVDLSFEQVFGDYMFPKVSLEANKYFTMYQRADGSGRHVLSLRSMVGWAGQDTPVFERFYGGGFQSLRGFAFRGVGPDENLFKVGGKFTFLNSAEYQVPILANDKLYVVGFLDSGTVERDIDITDYRVSAGVGLRLQIPGMGPVPIALDFGFPIVKGERDNKQIFSFYVSALR